MGCSDVSVLGVGPISDLPQDVKRFWSGGFLWLLCRDERCCIRHDFPPHAR